MYSVEAARPPGSSAQPGAGFLLRGGDGAPRPGRESCGGGGGGGLKLRCWSSSPPEVTLAKQNPGRAGKEVFQIAGIPPSAPFSVGYHLMIRKRWAAHGAVAPTPRGKPRTRSTLLLYAVQEWKPLLGDEGWAGRWVDPSLL